MICGGIEVSYPFGQTGTGCGDPDFQMYSCDSDNYPMIHISGNQYHILESSFLENPSAFKIMRIVNDNLFGGNCNFSGNYSQFWLLGSLFQINDNTYTNLSTLWKDCDQVLENINGYNLSFCGDNWNYSLIPHLNLERTPFCNAFQLPFNKSVSQQSKFTNSLARGFYVTWHVNPSRSQSCDACLKSNGSCGYNISEPNSPFLCYCPNSTSNPHKCPGNDSFPTSFHKFYYKHESESFQFLD